MSQINMQGNQGKFNIKGDTKNIKISISIGSIVLIVAIAFTFLSNSKTGIRKEIIGTWQSREEIDIFMTFEKNNMLTMKDGDIYVDGTYTFLDNNSIVLNLPYENMDYGYSGNISIEHDILTISNVQAVDDNINLMGNMYTFELIK